MVGTPFYVMQHVAGRIFLDQSLPSMTVSDRSAAYSEMVRVLAALHSVNPAAANLASFGKGDNYGSRCGRARFVLIRLAPFRTFPHRASLTERITVFL